MNDISHAVESEETLIYGSINFTAENSGWIIDGPNGISFNNTGATESIPLFNGALHRIEFQANNLDRFLSSRTTTPSSTK